MTDAARPDVDLAQAAAESKAADLAILKQSLDETKDQLLRLRADFDNYRKRAERERVEARRWGKEDLILKLLSVLDVLEYAEAAAHKGAELKPIVQGLDMLYKEFKRVLKEEGLEEVPAEGRPLDPAVHEAVETVEDAGEENRVLAVLQRGYRLAGNLLRPARVKVSCKHSSNKSAN